MISPTPWETSHEFDFSLEEYIAGLKWSDQATDHEKTLVVGNLRAMFAVIREKHNAFVLAARTLGVGFDQYDNLFKALVRDGIIEFKNDKVRILSIPSATGAIAEVSAERRRQIDEEGWNAEHDDEHPAGNLSAAAACYAAGVQLYDEQERNIWPWEERWWKPKDQRRNLIRAAALIIAEIEKLDRKTQYVGEKP